jgi:hypothetical protein
MAISKNNPLTKGASGMIGKTLVFRSFNGKTYMYNRPSKPKKQSPQQKENRTKFSRAVAFAKKMMTDEAKKVEYKAIAKQQKLPNAYTAAVTEYMRKPEIREVDTTNYTGKENEPIAISVKKKGFEIQEVEVIILNEKGNIVEKGNAIKEWGEKWLFKTSTNIDLSEHIQIQVKVKDRTNQSIEKLIKIPVNPISLK